MNNGGLSFKNENLSRHSNFTRLVYFIPLVCNVFQLCKSARVFRLGKELFREGQREIDRLRERKRKREKERERESKNDRGRERGRER